MRRIKRFHLIVLLAIAAGWIARDLIPAGPGIGQKAHAVYGVGDNEKLVAFTASGDGLTLVRWDFTNDVLMGYMVYRAE